MSKKNDLTTKTDADLSKDLLEAQASLQKHRFDVAAGKSTELDKMKKARKMIAQIKTEQSRRRLQVTA